MPLAAHDVEVAPAHPSRRHLDDDVVGGGGRIKIDLRDL
jgi:hypothetical protein